jgi:hypothetical protein
VSPRAFTQRAPTRQTTNSTVTGPLVAAIEAAWLAIQQMHPEVPHIVLTLGNGTAKAGQLTFGHFHDAKWATEDNRMPELFIGGEGLRRGARALLGTLLHEAAHGVASIRGVKDTSRQGRYHNTKFRDIAVELGITVDKDPKIGWSITTVPDLTAADYADQIDELDQALIAYRLADVPNGKPKTNNGIVAECGCEPARKIRLSRSTHDLGPIDCGICEQPFTDATEEG